jgi:hypothetical protein
LLQFFSISKGDRFPSNFSFYNDSAAAFGRVPTVFMFGTVVGLLGLVMVRPGTGEHVMRTVYLLLGASAEVQRRKRTDR